MLDKEYNRIVHTSLDNGDDSSRWIVEAWNWTIVALYHEELMIQWTYDQELIRKKKREKMRWSIEKEEKKKILYNAISIVLCKMYKASLIHGPSQVFNWFLTNSTKTTLIYINCTLHIVCTLLQTNTHFH